jgi:hypothetical protein
MNCTGYADLQRQYAALIREPHAYIETRERRLAILRQLLAARWGK